MAYFIFNVAGTDALQVTRLLRLGLWALRPEEPHGDALAPGDLALIYLAAPERVFVGRAELTSPVHGWSAEEAQAYPDSSASGVSLARVEIWDPPVPMGAVLSQIDQSGGARADFEDGVVPITEGEYATALSVAAA